MYISRFKKKFDRYCSEEFKFPKEYTKIELGVGNSKVFKDTLGIDINPNSDADEISDIFDYLDKQKENSISFIYSFCSLLIMFSPIYLVHSKNLHHHSCDLAKFQV